jgi:AbrB family looped-hinge helix DNA binding protein
VHLGSTKPYVAAKPGFSDKLLGANGAIMHTYLQDRGRIVIPIEIRKRLNIQKGDLIYFTETGSGVTITTNKHYNFERRQEEKDESTFGDLITEEKGNNEITFKWDDQELADIIQYES